MTNTKRKKNGFSIAEVVIALSIIVIVSIASLSIISSSASARKNAVNKTEAQNFAENLLECFKVSDSLENFCDYVNFAEGAELVNGETDENGFTVYAYESEKNKFQSQIKVKFSDVERSEFAIQISDSEGESIISFSYRKGI